MKLIKLFLVFGLVNYSLLSGAAAPNTSCIEKDKKIAPPVAQRTTTNSAGETVDTQVWIDWKAPYPSPEDKWKTTKDWNCCEKLVLNTATRVCEDKSVVDQGLQSCVDHTDCPGDKGCLLWREEDMFDESRASTEADKTALSLKAEEFEQAREEYDELTPDGQQFCMINMQCDSYKCGPGFRCEKNLICRLATDKDLPTPVKVNCEEPFKKNNVDKCVNPNATFYNGLLGEIMVVGSGAGRCQFELAPTAPGTTTENIPGAINLAIITTRAAEWLYSTLSKGDSMDERDCVYSKDYFRDKMIALVNSRKEIIKEFNREFKLIEDDFAEIQAAKKDDMSAISTICGDTTTNHDVAMRKSSGKDFLCYMRERNILFLHYEDAMFDWITEFNKVVTNYENDIKNWGETNKSWNIGGVQRDWKNSRTCRHWINLLVGVITPKKMKNRWISKYRHEKDPSSNSEMFSKYIETIGDGGNTDRLKKRHWQIDSLSPGKEDMSVENFVKSLRTAATPENDFVHEPEIASSYELRGCINKIEEPRCARYKKYLADLSDVAEAQRLMYSHHTKRKYKDYYQNEGSSRRRLISRYVTDATNLLNYYTASSKLRTQQNACIDRVLAQLNSSDFSGEGLGLAEGSSNYYGAPSTGSSSGNSGPKVNKPKIKMNMRAPIKFTLTGNNFSTSSDSTTKYSDTISGAGASGLIDSSALGALAARTKDMTDQNAKAAAAGQAPKKMEGDILSSLGSKGAGAGSGRGSNLGGLESSSSGALSGSGDKATIGDGAPNKNVMPNYKNSKGIPAAPVSTVTAGSGSGYDAGAGAGAAGDASGMSDEEKDRMSANYDRSKGEYKTKEDDTLFQVLSKTYVRNLDKILTRKKKLDEDAASAPSEPSAP